MKDLVIVNEPEGPETEVEGRRREQQGQLGCLHGVLPGVEGIDWCWEEMRAETRWSRRLRSRLYCI